MNNHWKYYLMLENRLIKTLDCVELSQDNYNTYSNEFAALLQIIGAELDNFFKVYCGFCLSERKNITDYANSIVSSYPDILNQEISIMGKDIVLKPFENWNINNASQSLFWWEAFCKVKNNRVDEFKNASLKNCLYCLAGLYLLEIKYLSIITSQKNEADIPDEESQLFNLKNWTFNYSSMKNMFAVTYDGTLSINDKNK